MKSLSEMSIGELAAFVSTHLFKNNINCTLSGGSCVSIYTKNRYESFDLDFIEQISTSRIKKRKVLSEIGFVEENRYFKNQNTKYIIEFPAGPLGIGEEMFVNTEIKNFETGSLKMLTATDCLMDRLVGFYHWDDLQCFEQAILVAQTQEIDYKRVEKWSKSERELTKFKHFIKSLSLNNN